MSAPQPGRDRYAQCHGDCTVDCGACKGRGRPAAPSEPPAEAQQDDGPPDETVVRSAERFIADQVATWEVTFDAGPGAVVSLSDAAHAAARWHRSLAARPSADTETLRERIESVMYRLNVCRANAAEAQRPAVAMAYDDAAEWLRRAMGAP